MKMQSLDEEMLSDVRYLALLGLKGTGCQKWKRRLTLLAALLTCTFPVNPLFGCTPAPASSPIHERQVFNCKLPADMHGQRTRLQEWRSFEA